MIKMVVLMFALMMPALATATIVNTLQGFNEDQPGWSGGIDGSFSNRGGNTELSRFAGGCQVQWLGESERWRLLGSAVRATSQGTEIAKALTSHLRHNHRLSAAWHTLTFAQIQQNPFQRLSSRMLIGAGFRWDVWHQSSGLLALGATHMVEIEKIEDQTDSTTDQRLSVFLKSSLPLRTDVKLDAMAFYQPLWSDFGDARVMASLKLQVKLVGDLSLFTGGDLEYDPQPAAGVEKSDWSTSTGLRYKF